MAATVADAVAEAGVPVRPGGTCCTRRKTGCAKRASANNELPVAPFCRANSLDELTGVAGNWAARPC
ncbi:MAG: hypothetical protein R3A44_28535 [Caldilineaceae bacterium]